MIRVCSWKWDDCVNRQDRLAYGPTFESAMAALFGGAVSSMTTAAVRRNRGEAHPHPQRRPSPRRISTRSSPKQPKTLPTASLTAEGKLGEAGQKLEELKRAVDKLNTRKR